MDSWIPRGWKEGSIWKGQKRRKEKIRFIRKKERKRKRRKKREVRREEGRVWACYFTWICSMNRPRSIHLQVTVATTLV